MSRLIMALTGPPGAGKSTAGEYLSMVHDFCAVEGSDCLRSAAEQMGRPITQATDYEAIARLLQQTVSGSWIAERVLAQGGERPLHVGLRTEQDFRHIKQCGGLVVALVCPPEICRDRINQVRPGSFPSPESYLAQVALETSTDGWGSNTPWTIEHADYHIDASGKPGEVFRQLDVIVAEQELM